MSELTLFIDSRQVPFQSASLSFSLERLAHTFSVTIPYIEINQPLPVEFKLDNQVIFTGRIDSVSDDVSGSEDKVSISGRSISADLIDSRIKIDAIYNQRLDQLLESIVSDFGLGVKNNLPSMMPLPLVPEFQINAESPVANLAQIAKQQNLMLIEQNGVLVIEQPGQFTERNIKLAMGENTLNISIKKSWAEQFFHYEIQGAWDGAEATVFNKSITRCRQKVIIADKLQDEASCRTRALYERNMAIAKGLHVSATLPGLFPELTGFALNKLISVQKRQFKENLLIKTVNISVNESSEKTSLELFRPFGA
ncbi:hypothetical protein [Psychromonas aquimarina]|uniref:hypothetical protein n=1 Tax=Psychromonas aquimarina TaxID=444919 RepID=UPI0003F60CE7|nr:hypothetical protein [Psychromonas aquimarina]